MKGLVEELRATKTKAQRTGATMNIQATQEQYDFACRLKQAGKIKSKSAYVRSLIDADMKRREELELQDRFKTYSHLHSVS